MKKTLWIICFLTFLFSPLYAQLRPGIQLWTTGFNTSIISRGFGGISFYDSAFNTLNNPAASAYIDNTRIFGSGILSSPQEGGGAFGIATPTITRGTLYFGSQFLSYDGTIFNQIGYGKRIRSDLAFGIEGIITVHPTAQIHQIGGGWNFGWLWSPRMNNENQEGFGFFDPSLGFIWKTVFFPTGFTCHNIVPSMNFQIGFNANIYKVQNFKWNISADYALGFVPLPQNTQVHLSTWLSLGTGFVFWDIWGISIGTVFGNNGIGFGSDPILPFTLGTSIGQEFNQFSFQLAYSFGLDQFNNNQPELLHAFSLEFGIGASNNKGISSRLTLKDGFSNTVYISPNSDKIQDTAVLYPSIISDYDVQSWRLVIFNEQGHTVRTFHSENDNIDPFGVENFFVNYFTSSSIGDLPNEIIWNGRNNSGTIVSDGIYYTYLAIRYNEDQIIHSDTNIIVVDNTAPAATLSIPKKSLYLGETPDDRLDIFQDISPNFWVARLYNQENPDIQLQEWEWTPNTISNFNSWSLLDPNQINVSSGIYNYQLSSVDQSGNSTTVIESNIIIEITNREAFLNSRRFSFSPNNDGFLDTISFQTIYRGLFGLEKSELYIYNEQRQQVFHTNLSVTELSKEIIWDGKNQDQNILPSGNYLLQLVNTYVDGKVIKSPDIIANLDTYAPSFETIEIANNSRLSPDGDGINDSIDFSFRTEDLHSISNWIVYFKKNGETIDTIRGRENEAQISWSPRVNADLKTGEKLSVEFFVQDILGNKRTLPLFETRIDVLTDPHDMGRIITKTIGTFDEGKGVLSSSLFTYLDEIWINYRQFPQDELTIRSHAYNSESSSEDEIYRLSVSRADSIKEYLVQKGVPRSKISIDILPPSNEINPSKQEEIRQAKIYLQRR